MENLWKQLSDDDTGLVISAELILLGVVALFGLMAGTTSIRDAVISEFSDVAGAVQDINQSYIINGVTGHSVASAGSDFIDESDFCDDDDDIAGQADNCIAFSGGFIGGSETVTVYTNDDKTTDLSASQNATTLKWQLEPGQQAEADAVTQAILDCIALGHSPEITWVDHLGGTHTFTADTVIVGGPEFFAFTGSNSGASASGKIISATVSCPDDAGAGSGD